MNIRTNSWPAFSTLANRGFATLIAAVLVVVFAQSAAFATFNSATGVAAPGTITPANTSTTINYAFVVSSNQQPQQISVLSQNGQFFAPTGELLGTLNSAISQQVPVPPTGAQNIPVAISEVIAVPATVINNAVALGANQVIFRRVFVDAPDQTTATVNVPLLLAAANGAPLPPPAPGAVPQLPANPAAPAVGARAALQVLRVDLGFEDGAATAVKPLRSNLYAFAEITYRSTGLLDGVWEVANPISMAGQPTFRVLANERRALGLGGRLLLRSPPLPTNTEGVYVLRFRVLDPAVGFAPPILRYVIHGQPQPQIAMQAFGPAECALDTPAKFRWQPVNTAAAYQLEVFDQAEPQESVRPVSGMLLPADFSETDLSELARSHLFPGRRYWWRVVAFGTSGEKIGSSPLAAIDIR